MLTISLCRIGVSSGLSRLFTLLEIVRMTWPSSGDIGAVALRRTSELGIAEFKQFFSDEIEPCVPH